MKITNKTVTEDEVVISGIAGSSLNYMFRLNELCRVTTKEEGTIEGKLSYIGETYFGVSTGNSEEIRFSYSSIVEIVSLESV